MRRLLSVTFVLLAAGCGSGGAPSRPAGQTHELRLPTLPATAVPGLHHTDRLLDESALVRESVSIADIRRQLERWGFQGGEERLFRGTSRDLTGVVSRTLQFRSAAGAAAYVRFVREHASPFLGTLGHASAFRAGGRSGFVLTAQSCGCHNETPLLLYVASHGRRVSWVLINGPRATKARALRLGARAP
jgi:hypothetical protein